MRRQGSGFLFLGFLGALLLSAGCGGSAEQKTDCNDGIDNDGDELIDDQDPACPFTGGMNEFDDPVQCNNGLDDDGDSLIDTADYGCENADDNEEADPTRQCNDGVDNDGDGFSDYSATGAPGSDPGCESPIDDDEFNPAACGDGNDNDGDARADYPFDPGCESADDPDETDPSPTPQCGDGLDNDADSLVDFGQDPGCSSASDNEEFNTVVGECGPSVVITNITATGDATGEITGPLPNELSSDVCNGYGGEFAFTYTLTTPKALYITTDNPETTLDTVVYVRTECRRADTELGCDDDSGTVPHTSSLLLPLVEPGSYYIIVDSFGPGSLGSFHLTVSERNPLHGACDPVDPEACIPGLVCRSFMPGDPTTCEYPECQDTIDNDGDGDVDYPNDSGCDQPADNGEVLTGAEPMCNDGADNDGDGFSDYPDDMGCLSAADGSEIDECVPGSPVIDHLGGSVTGTTIGSPSLLSPPTGCDSTGGSGGAAPETVYVFNANNDYTNLRFSTVGSSFDTLLYVRYGDCGVDGPSAYCNDNGAGSQSVVNIPDPPPGFYFAIVDGQWGGSGTLTLSITGTIDVGGSCIVGSSDFQCTAGSACSGVTGLCEPAACNDGTDNDGDGDVDYPFDPGCTSISDADEADPVPTPQCGDGIDNDADGATDYPADDSCGSASDDDESCASFGTTTFGYNGCQDTFPLATPPCDDIHTTGTIACSGDDCTGSAALPFTFDYFGVPQTTVTISSNGKLGFTTTSTYSNTCTIEPTTVAAYWDDLYPPSGGGVYYETLGAAPDRRFVVNWNVPHISGGTFYDIRAVLHEGSNDIDLCYLETTTLGTTTDLGASATVGINGTAAGDMLSFSCNLPNVTEGLQLHFSHP